MKRESKTMDSRRCMKVRRTGLSTEPGQCESRTCGVCGETMDVKRNVTGPTSFAEAMMVQSGKSQGHLHDEFWCNFENEEWHCQGQAILEMVDETPSQRLTVLLTEEFEEIVRTRKATKIGW